MKTLKCLFFVAVVLCSASHSVQGQIPQEQVAELWGKAIEEGNVAEKAMEVQHKRSVTLLKVFETMLDNPKVFDTFEIVDTQKKEIAQLQDNYSLEKSKLEKNLKSGQITKPQRDSALLILKKKTVQKLSDIFLDHQLEVFNELSMHVSGMPRSFTESSVGEAIELTEKERTAIRKRSETLSKEVQEFTKQARRKAYSALFADLSAKRVEKIRKFYGGKQFDAYFSNMTLPKLASDFSYNDKRTILEKEMRQTPIDEITSSKQQK